MRPVRLATVWAMTALACPAIGSEASPWPEAEGTAALIDRFIGEAQREAGIAPSPVADDAEFLRRVSLDLTGRVPEAALAESFLRSEAPDKRQRLVEHLMGSETYREGQATLWTTWLLGREGRQRSVNRTLFRQWVRDEVIAVNLPHDVFARELLTATGRNDEVGAVSYLLQFERERADAAGMVSRHFLGRQIQCAQCHDHKTEPFTQAQFWGMAAFFGKTFPRPVRNDEGRPIAVELFDRARARPPRIPETDQIIEPRYLDGSTMPIRGNAGGDLRDALARKITDPSDPRLAQATVNRLWAHFTGRGFVEPVDDFRPSNPAEFPQLLQALTDGFRQHGFDREHLIRAIVMSETYQRSSIPTEDNAQDVRLYTHARLRPLSPEQLLWSLATVTGVDPHGRAGPRRNPRTGRLVTREERIDQLVLRFVSRHSDEEMDETTAFEGTIPLSLFMMNSPQVERVINARRGPTLSALLERTQDPARIAEGIYLAALSRPPTEEERAIAVRHLSSARATRIGQHTLAEDLLWALLNTSEFMFH